MEVEGELSVPGTAQKSLISRSNPADEVEDEENLFELEIKNLDTNEVFKMQIPIGGQGNNSNEPVILASSHGVEGESSARKIELTQGATRRRKETMYGRSPLPAIRFVRIH